MKLILLVVAILLSVSAEIIECPTFRCMGAHTKEVSDYDKQNGLDQNVCFQHDDQQPTKQMLAYDCKEHQRLTESLRSDNVVCDFSVASNKYAWINEEFQHLSADQVYADADNKDQS